MLRSTAARRWFRDHGPECFGSDLLMVESVRAARRIAPEVVAATRSLLDALPLLRLDHALCWRAATLDPTILRSLDALHLASAMAFADELDGIVTYDERLAEAARAYGIPVVAPR